MYNDKHLNFLVLIALVMGLSFSAFAFEKAVREAQQLIAKGEVDAALTLLKETQVDYPKALELRFGIACAEFAKGKTLMQSGSVDEAKAAFSEARSLFASMSQDQNTNIAREATFNNATVIAQEALGSAEGGDYAASVAALRQAVEAYENGLSRFPNHEGMRNNLEHVGYKLKEMLQNPPPKQEDPEKQPPPESPPTILSRFGHAATELPGARTQVEENTAILLPPKQQEPKP